MALHYTVAAQTDAGIVKSINQDSLMVKVIEVHGIEAAFAVICDGMGGLEQGEVASAVVVKNFEQWFLKDFPKLLEVGLEPGELENIWKRLIDDCNIRIKDYSDQCKASMGTTLTALLLFNGYYFISHIGDCRVYKMSGKLKQLTTDQTYVAREVALGHMTPEQAENDSRRSVLLQCIGTGKKISPDFEFGEIRQGETFLLCSDGFRHKLTEKELYINCHAELLGLGWCVDKRFENTEIMNARIRELIELDKKRMENDNISAILLKVSNQ